MSRTHSKLYVHVVFGTKQRHPWIDPELQAELYPFLTGAVGKHGATVLALGGMPDHVHLLVRVRPRLSIAELVKSIKGTSSRWIIDRSAGGSFGWQEGYGVFSVSSSHVDRVRRYIENQEWHHRDLTSEAELERLMRGPQGERDRDG